MTDLSSPVCPLVGQITITAPGGRVHVQDTAGRRWLVLDPTSGCSVRLPEHYVGRAVYGSDRDTWHLVCGDGIGRPSWVTTANHPTLKVTCGDLLPGDICVDVDDDMPVCDEITRAEILRAQRGAHVPDGWPHLTVASVTPLAERIGGCDWVYVEMTNGHGSTIRVDSPAVIVCKESVS